MNVSGVLIVIMAVLFAGGVYAMLERSLTRVLIGFLLLGNAANLLLLIVMGRPGIAPFFGDADKGEFSDPLPQAMTLTAIVITFAVSAFLLALIYRSWQLGQADTVEDDLDDVAMRAAEHLAEEDALDDEVEVETADEAIFSDFVDTATAPITVIHHRDLAAVVDDAPVDRPHPRRPDAGERSGGAERPGGTERPEDPDRRDDPAGPDDGGNRS
ncbi:hypothetical protein GCM10022240_01850 [Microbacterium kribbense]|uniref:Na(+)/H(+) antiporter subunit C n=1 Tax=Microbacterium kribbense TaxID=433645 RepID=A0ABP7FZI7_9MICO